MKLYYYDHCPFCTRARMILSLAQQPYEGVILANDDEATPISLIGKKMLPILVKEDGEAMGESLDIVQYIVEKTDMAFDRQVREEMKTVLESMRSYFNPLFMPRCVKIDLEEFASQAAIDYFVHKKEQSIGDFSEHLAQTEQYLVKLNADLQTLDPLIVNVTAANGNAPGMEDILLFPLLRNLSMVKDVTWPTRVHAYMTNMSRRSQIPLLFSQAV